VDVVGKDNTFGFSTLLLVCKEMTPGNISCSFCMMCFKSVPLSYIRHSSDPVSVWSNFGVLKSLEDDSGSKRYRKIVELSSLK
jgi:hypothetical protein